MFPNGPSKKSEGEESPYVVFPGMLVTAQCKGSAPEAYKEWISFDRLGIVVPFFLHNGYSLNTTKDACCSCPVGKEGTCAVLLHFRDIQQNKSPSDKTKISPLKDSPSKTSPSKRFGAYGFNSPLKVKPVDLTAQEHDNIPSSNITQKFGTPSPPNPNPGPSPELKKLRHLLQWTRAVLAAAAQSKRVVELQHRVKDLEEQLHTEQTLRTEAEKEAERRKQRLSTIEEELSVLRGVCGSIKQKVDSLWHTAKDESDTRERTPSISWSRNNSKEDIKEPNTTKKRKLNDATNAHSTEKKMKQDAEECKGKDSNLKGTKGKDLHFASSYNSSTEDELLYALQISEKMYRNQQVHVKSHNEMLMDETHADGSEDSPVTPFQKTFSSLNSSVEVSVLKEKKLLLAEATPGAYDDDEDEETTDANEDLKKLLAKSQQMKKESSTEGFASIFLKKPSNKKS